MRFEQGFAVRRQSPAEIVYLSNFGATLSSTVRSVVQPFDREAGVGLSAFAHRFPPFGGQRGRTPQPTDLSRLGIVQEGWGNPYTSIVQASKETCFLPMPFGLRSGSPRPVWLTVEARSPWGAGYKHCSSSM